MNTDKTLKALALLFTALLVGGCGPDAEAVIGEGEGEDGESLDALTTVSNDDLNGLWVATVGGVALPDDAVVESWPAAGIRLHLQQNVYQLTRTADALSGTQVTLAVKANGSGVANDTLEGTVAGATVVLKRDTAAKPPITITFPGDRPFRSFLTEVLVPAAQRDRESYTVMRSYNMGTWLRDCELYRRGSWQRTFMKGATWSEQSTAFNNVLWAVNNIKTTPRRMTKEYKFSTALKANLKDPNQIGLAMSTFSMYFTTAGGRAQRRGALAVRALGAHRLVLGDGHRGLPRRRVRLAQPELGLQHDERAVLRARRARSSTTPADAPRT